MAISTRLSRKLRESLGDEGANDLVDWMVQVEDRRSELQGVFEAWKSEAAARFAEFGARMDARFSEIDTRFSQIDIRFSQIDIRFAQIDTRFSEMETRFVKVDMRFVELEKHMEVGFAEQREAMARLEARIEQRFGDLIKWSFVFWCGAIGAMSLLTR